MVWYGMVEYEQKRAPICCSLFHCDPSQLSAMHIHHIPPHPLRLSHVLHTCIPENLAVVHIPHCLVVPHLGGEEDGAQHNPLPVARVQVQLSIVEGALQIHLQGGRGGEGRGGEGEGGEGEGEFARQ